jgi:hypothetical protein
MSRSASLLGLLVISSALPPAFPSSAGACFPNEIVCFLTSEVTLDAPVSGCQYVFTPSPASERLAVNAVLRDAFANPVGGFLAEFTLVPDPETPMCACGALTASALSDADGTARVEFGLLGGHGTFTVQVRAFDPDTGAGGWIVGDVHDVPFTSADQNASCDPVGPVTNIVDIALWAQGLPPSPYRLASDLDCDGTVNIMDLGLLATGLAAGCSD